MAILLTLLTVLDRESYKGRGEEDLQEFELLRSADLPPGVYREAHGSLLTFYWTDTLEPNLLAEARSRQARWIDDVLQPPATTTSVMRS